jgi:hypothetical protein
VKPGDLVEFATYHAVDPETPIDFEEARVGLVVDVIMYRPRDFVYGDELIILHEGQRWSIPSAWCRHMDGTR